MTPNHYVAYMLTPKRGGQSLDDGEIEKIYEHIATVNPTYLPIIMKYQSKTAPFMPFRFIETVTAGISPIMVWWQVIGNLEPQFLPYVTKLMTAINFSASIESFFDRWISPY